MSKLKELKELIYNSIGKEHFREACRHKLMHDENGCPFGEGSHLREIRLADVLLAIQETPKVSKIVIDDYGVFWDFNTLSNSTLQERPFFWNLKQDDLSLQSPETLDFLATLLSPKKV